MEKLQTISSSFTIGNLPALNDSFSRSNGSWSLKLCTSLSFVSYERGRDYFRFFINVLRAGEDDFVSSSSRERKLGSEKKSVLVRIFSTKFSFTIKFLT